MLRFLLSPYGRVSLGTYWVAWLIPSYVLSTAMSFLDTALVRAGSRPFIGTLTSLVILWPSIAITAKRLHDRGMSGWWQIAWFALYGALIAAGYFHYRAKALGEPSPLQAIADAPFDPANVWIVIAGAVIVGFAGYVIVNLAFLPGQPGPNRYADGKTEAEIAGTFT